MKKNRNFGFPLSYILLRLIILILITLIILLLFFLNFSYYILSIISFVILPIYVFYSVIYFKNKFLKNREELLKKMIELANINGNELVLDLGTGSGFLAIGFAKKLKNGVSFGIDKFNFKNENLKIRIIRLIKINFIYNTLKNAIENAKNENLEDKCKFIKADITKPLNFTDDFFDIIVSCQFFYCIDKNKRKNVYKEINRVLKKGGKIIFFESKFFRDWNINEMKNFFEKNKYKISLIPSKDFKKCYILYGEKI